MLSLEEDDPMKSFVQVQDNGLKEILDTLFTKDNIELKSDVKNPLALSILKSIAVTADNVGMVKTGETLFYFIVNLLEFMVSFQRKGRQEFVDAFKSTTPSFEYQTGNLMKKEA